MTYFTDSTGNGNIVIGGRIPGRKRFISAADSVKEFHKATFEELIEEKNPGISFELLPTEVKQKAQEKLKAFDDIVKPNPDQKQEHHTDFQSEEQEFRFWYDQVLPNLVGIPSSDKSK